MLGVSSGLIASTIVAADGAAGMAVPPPLPTPPPQEAPESGGSSEGGGGGGDMSVGGGGFSEEGERNSGGNRWPRQETLALLKIRSEMDVVFKDSSLKGPLWEQVSRKMADLGYHRSAKKCKEKFENVYKYHRRTKEGRASKADGKTYRFFDQLQALENNPASHSLPPPPLAATPITMAMPMRSGNVSAIPPVLPAGQNHNHPFVVSQNTVVTAAAPAVSHIMTSPALPLSQPQQQPQPAVQPITNNLNQMNRPQGNTSTSFLSNSTSSSSTSSDEDIQRRHMKKRKWKEFFESLMKDVIEKQEEMQKKFLETLEKRERDRLMREETWREQEMARLNREHDLLVQERSMAAAKDATIIAFLQKITEQQNTPIPNSTNNTSPSPPAQIQSKLSEKPLVVPVHSQPPQSQPQPQPQPPGAIAVSLPMTIHTPAPLQPQALSLPVVAAKSTTDNGGENFSPPSSSRWPKEEIEALIRLRTCLDLKYQENGPKGPLWQEISAGMRKIGYNRNAKRCKEKWENINKYFKKVKESNKKRPEDSKTCPYFHQLEALYKEKAKNEAVQHTAGFGLRPENNNPIAPLPPPPIMAQPEQQWPLPQHHQPQVLQQQQQQNRDHHDNESDDSMEHNEEEDNMEEDDDQEDESDSGYEMVTNKQASSMAAATTVSAAAATTAV